jgi:hypothetical protein
MANESVLRVAKMRTFYFSPHVRSIRMGVHGFMSARTIAVLVAAALCVLGTGGVLWAVDALRAPEPPSVNPIELEEDEVLDERSEIDKKSKDRRHPRNDRRRPHKSDGENRESVPPPAIGTDESSEGAPVVTPPPPEEAGDGGQEREDREQGEDRDD